MKELFILIAHLLTTLVRLAQPGGVRAVAAQSLALRHQLLVLQRRRQRTPADPMGSSVLRSVALVVAESANEGFDSAVTFDFRAVSRSLGPLQVPIALYLQAPRKTGAEMSLGGAHCRRGGDETPKSEVRVSENRPADFVCVRR